MGRIVTVSNGHQQRKETYSLVLQSLYTCRRMHETQVRRLSRSSSCRHAPLPKRISHQTFLRIRQRTFQGDPHSCLVYNPSEKLGLHTGCPSECQHKPHQDTSSLHLLLPASPCGYSWCSRNLPPFASTHETRVIYNMLRRLRKVALYYHNCHPCSKHSDLGCYPTIFQYRGCPFESIFGKRRFFIKTLSIFSL